MCDYIVVGASFAGSVMVERIANVLDKKSSDYRKKRSYR